ncbi:MAG TPA: O-antigen ligase family protein [Bacteroidia bacterium]|nr:O-antigen ligase family protein [Bacteroidia bacterium]HNU32128.1 O-antigen ligase family protein [Bacteroidia bacterium]
MLDFLKRNAQFTLMILVWVFCGIINQWLATAVVLACVVLLKQKSMYRELIWGFFFILVMGDNREFSALYGATAKVPYLLLLTTFYFLDSKNFKFKNDFFYPYILFLAVAFVAMSQGPAANLINATQKWLSFLLLYSVIPMYFLKMIKEHGTEFIKDTLYLFAFFLIAGLIIYFVSRSSVTLAGRYSGIFGNPNGIGIFCTILFLLTFSVNYKFPGLLHRNDLIIVYVLLAISILMAASRTAMMSIFLFLIFVKFFKTSYWLGIPVLIIAIIGYTFISNNIVEIVKSLGLGEFLRADNIEDGSGRTLAWKMAWIEIQSHFILGRGFAYDEYYFRINQDWFLRKGHNGGIHNTWLALWMNAGVIGLALYLFGFLKLFTRVIGKFPLALPLLFSVLFSASFEAWLMGSLNPFHIVFVLLFSIVIYDQYATKQEESTVSVL